jgi:hypothetical protein
VSLGEHGLASSRARGLAGTQLLGSRALGLSGIRTHELSGSWAPRALEHKSLVLKGSRAPGHRALGLSGTRALWAHELLGLWALGLLHIFFENHKKNLLEKVVGFCPGGYPIYIPYLVQYIPVVHKYEQFG